MYSSRPKIGILVFLEEDCGGVFQYAQSMIDALPKNSRFQFVVFTKKGGKQFNCGEHEIRVIDIKSNFFDKLFRFFKLLFLTKYFPVVSKVFSHFNEINFFVSPVISPFPHFFLNKPFVFTLHDMQERHLPHFFSYIERTKRFILNRALLSTARAVICESGFIKQDIIHFSGICKNKVYVIKAPPVVLNGNGLSSVSSDKIKCKYKIPDNFIFYPAQLWPHKNHKLLIRAFLRVKEKHSDLKLILTGTRNGNYKELQRFIKELRLENSVLHFGYVSQEDLQYFYLFSKMLIMPTLFESLSIPIYEALVLGVPVCASRIDSLVEQAEGACVFFDPNDYKDIANKIIFILDNPDFVQNLRRNGFQLMASINQIEYSAQLESVLEYCV